MKIRSDFVTNSSTAAYVLYGFEIPKDFDFVQALRNLGEIDFEDCDPEDLFYEVVQNAPADVGCLHEDEDGLKKGQHVIGVYIACVFSEDYLKSEVRDLADFVKPVTALHMKVGADTPIKLYIGTKWGRRRK